MHAEHERLAAIPVCQEPEMSDLYEGPRGKACSRNRRMNSTASNGHQLLPISVAGVSPSECDLACARLCTIRRVVHIASFLLPRQVSWCMLRAVTADRDRRLLHTCGHSRNCNGVLAGVTEVLQNGYQAPRASGWDACCQKPSASLGTQVRRSDSPGCGQ